MTAPPELRARVAAVLPAMELQHAVSTGTSMGLAEHERLIDEVVLPLLRPAGR